MDDYIRLGDLNVQMKDKGANIKGKFIYYEDGEREPTGEAAGATYFEPKAVRSFAYKILKHEDKEGKLKGKELTDKVDMLERDLLTIPSHSWGISMDTRAAAVVFVASVTILAILTLSDFNPISGFVVGGIFGEGSWFDVLAVLLVLVVGFVGFRMFKRKK